MIFFTRRISGAIGAMAVFGCALPIVSPYWRRLRGLPADAPARQEA